MKQIECKIITESNDMLIPELGRLLSEANIAPSIQVGCAKVQLELSRRERYILAYHYDHDQMVYVGLVSWRMEGYYDHGIYELTHIASSVTLRHQGVGRLLFNQMELDAYSYYQKHGYHLRKLFVRTGSPNGKIQRGDANMFYEKLGMQLEYVAPKHFRNYRDENVWVKYYTSDYLPNNDRIGGKKRSMGISHAFVNK